MTETTVQSAKKAAASRAVDFIDDDMIVGLGTGSTAKYAIEMIGQRVADGLRIQGVPTSTETAELAREIGIPLRMDFTDIAV
ncbi:MAG: ribose 5-phosphate isomerase A, partial [bacterium]